jgi:phosphoribosylanthranilate isomerase
VRTFVKLCGLREPETVALLPPHGAGGVVIEVVGSPRSVGRELALSLFERFPQGVERWAVLADPSRELLRTLLSDRRVDRVQLHGAIPERLSGPERARIVPSMAIPPPGTDPDGDLAFGPVPDHPLVHLDAAVPGTRGGTGAVSDWELCRRLVAGHPGQRFLLSGGLTPENVVPALGIVRPWGVDVSSGIESAPGVKDPARIVAFLGAMREYEAAHA